MAISRKNFGALSIADLKKTVTDLSNMVDEAAKGGEGVDLQALKAEVHARQDPALLSAFERVNHEYARFRGDSESASPTLRSQVRPQDVKSVMNMMIEAKKAFSDLDTDNDGKLDRQEVLHARYVRQTPGAKIASAVALGSHADLELALNDWLCATPKSSFEMSMRARVYGELERQVGLTQPSPKGERALRAYLQNFLVTQRDKFSSSGGASAERGMRSVLKGAEKNFFVRLFGISHLDDKEITKLVGTSDFDAFAEGIDAKMHERFGVSFTEAWLDGHDVDPNDAKGFRFSPMPS